MPIEQYPGCGHTSACNCYLHWMADRGLLENYVEETKKPSRTKRAFEELREALRSLRRSILNALDD